MSAGDACRLHFRRPRMHLGAMSCGRNIEVMSQSPALPKLKASVRFFPVEGDLFHVYDASTAKHFKLGAQEVSWLRLLDGETPVDTLRQKIPMEYFDAFFAAVGRLGVLEGSPVKKQSSLLKIKLFQVDPSALLARMGGFSVIYRQFLTWTCVPLLVLNVLLLSALWPQIQTIVPKLQPSFGLIPMYLLFVTVVGVAHEFSHALVARSHGVAVPHIGGMLMFFHPAFFADISGINLMPDRSRRVQVIFAGIQANNLLAAISLSLLMLPMGRMAFEWLLFFSAVNFVLILVNLIPFVEYDGYYIFQELLGEPRFIRNASMNVLGPQPKRLEYVLFFGLGQLFQFSLIASILLSLRLAVNLVWTNTIVDIVFLSLIVLSYPILAVYRIRKLA